MRTFCRPSFALITALFMGWLVPGAALADSGQYIINQNQTGLNLPGVTMPNGFDEIRAADGTTCRSSMGGRGAYLDSGVVGGGLNNNSSTLSAYGRVVVPMGKGPPRLDCDRLYQLELQRLELEVELLKRGLDPRMSAPTTNDAEWASDDGWTTGDRK
ncbi:hypothetical protein [Chelativorans salis]|uniref:Secreted protein n=1 Tax=Chelativorans salis TaxID=2978478 RepID=A0ABT2LLF0_9HYPH|nr:hypothetical protein [Chelativorans sp. EGI FJ00035]MCT7375257.1 hypothetical protein [Chelativorans sp. EGI FJ00035]